MALLAANVLPNASINFNDCPDVTGTSDISALNGCATDPSPIEGDSEWNTAHGTAVAGIIGMEGGNGLGGMGIAHEASLQGFNYLSGPQGFGSQLFALDEGNARAERTDVFNMSYGSAAPPGVLTLPDAGSVEAVFAMERVLAATRQSRGGLYLKSAGNAFEMRSSSQCQASIARDVGCLDALVDPTNSAFGIMVIGAVDSIGEPSSYSSAGANVWLSGFGGEFNHNRDLNPQATDVQIQPAILSTDWGTSCNVGYHSDRYKLGLTGVGMPPKNAFDNGSASTLDPECRYTAGFNGTSAAAPTVSGVTALVLQARPDLSARDIRHILAATARNVSWSSFRGQCDRGYQVKAFS